jgi:predicted N-acetyltransferase YhbS
MAYLYRDEGPLDGPHIESLLDRSFGADRRRKISYRYRLGLPPVAELSRVAQTADGRLVGTIRFWPVRIDAQPALLLGPVAIDESRRGQGIGRTLIASALATAAQAGWTTVLLVGDPSYYEPLGFRRAPPGLIMPGEAPSRLLGRVLPDGGELPIGTIRPWSWRSAGAAVEPCQERVPDRRERLVACHRLGQLAEPCGEIAGEVRLGGDLGDPTQVGSDREQDVARAGQAA